MLTINLSPIPAPNLWRVLHDAELPTGHWRDNNPEVFRFGPVNNTHQIPMYAPLQHLCYSLVDGIALNHWRSIYASDTAFTNGTGFDNPSSPRADFISGRDLTARLPAFDLPRVCGGATLSGIAVWPDLIVDTIRIDLGELPTLEWLEAHPWFMFTALNVGSQGVFNWAQGEGRPVRIPLVSVEQITIPLANVVQVGEMANPYYIS